MSDNACLAIVVAVIFSLLVINSAIDDWKEVELAKAKAISCQKSQ